MRLLKYILLLLLLPTAARAGVDFKIKESMLVSMLQAVSTEKDSAKKMALNAEFQQAFLETLQQEGAVRYGFKKLPFVYQVESADKRLRLLTWSAPAGTMLHFYGFALIRKSRWTKHAKVIALHENPMQAALLRHKILMPHQWAGALYTAILQRKDKASKQVYYTLLGLRLADNNFGSKIIDAATIAGDTLRFGAPIFNERNHKMYRMVFEYNPMVSMKLEWNKKLDKIVFTAMLPPYGMPRNDKQLYMPGDSYDGLTWDGSQWVYELDVPLPIDRNLQGRAGTGRSP